MYREHQNAWCVPCCTLVSHLVGGETAYMRDKTENIVNSSGRKNTIFTTVNNWEPSTIRFNMVLGIVNKTSCISPFLRSAYYLD